jgi:hypothetical protein
MKNLFKKLFTLVILFAQFSSLAKTHRLIQISSQVEQRNMPITKTFSLRLKDVEQIKINVSDQVKLIDLYYEDSLGNMTSVYSNKNIKKDKPFISKIEKSNLKKITYTVISNIETKDPVVLDLELLKID